MKLSICIPGYNRPEFLRWTLEKLTADFPQIDIVVRDDCSTEPMTTWHLSVHQPWRWIQGRENIGPFPNHREALLAARGQYAVYCANDDYLLPERVFKAIEYLDAHPEVSAYIAPCEIWNEVECVPFWNAFTCETRTFHVEHSIDLFNFIITNHVWPEHVIYRTPVALKPRTRAYWCFADLPDLLAQGAIHFDPKPFYRNLLVHPCGERVQLGNVQCLTFFDEYRGGLELLAYGLFGEQPYKARHQIHDMINAFICQRMFNASVLYERQGHALEAEMLRRRILVADARPDKPKAQVA